MKEIQSADSQRDILSILACLHRHIRSYLEVVAKSSIVPGSLWLEYAPSDDPSNRMLEVDLLGNHAALLLGLSKNTPDQPVTDILPIDEHCAGTIRFPHHSCSNHLPV